MVSKMSRLVKLIDQDNLYISKRITFTGVKNYSIVYYADGKRVIAAQSNYEHIKSKLGNKLRAYKRKKER